MNLVADIGNTRIKLALFEGDELKQHEYFVLTELHKVDGFINKHKADRAIVSSVVNAAQVIVDGIKSKVPIVLEYNAETKIPVKNLYKTTSTLGNDRIPSVVGAQRQFPDTAILVIDSGTCIKYNFLNKQGEYLGGGISPGLNMRFQALPAFTSRLPLIEQDAQFDKLIGTDTRESILSGVQMGAVAEIEGMINEYKKQHPGLKIVLTGGDSSFFEKRLKNAIFADPELVLRGLNIILNYNI
jgi:type III pantothenate kinase